MQNIFLKILDLNEVRGEIGEINKMRYADETTLLAGKT